MECSKQFIKTSIKNKIMESKNVFATLLAREVVNDIIKDKESEMFFDQGDLLSALEHAFIENDVNEYSTGDYVANITNQVIESVVRNSVDESIMNLIEMGLIKTAVNPEGELVYSLNIDNEQN